MKTKRNETIKKLNGILTLTDERTLLNFIFDSDDANERFVALKRLIELRETNDDSYFDVVEKFIAIEKNKEFIHRVVECINDNDLLVPIMNNHHRYKSAIVAEFKINDLHELNRLQEKPDDYKNIIRFLELPYSLSKVIFGNYSIDIQMEAIDRLTSLPNGYTLYGQIFKKDYANRVLENSGEQILVA